jgi:hypothetical protein
MRRCSSCRENRITSYHKLKVDTLACYCNCCNHTGLIDSISGFNINVSKSTRYLDYGLFYSK